MTKKDKFPVEQKDDPFGLGARGNVVLVENFTDEKGVLDREAYTAAFNEKMRRDKHCGVQHGMTTSQQYQMYKKGAVDGNKPSEQSLTLGSRAQLVQGDDYAFAMRQRARQVAKQRYKLARANFSLDEDK